VVSLVGRSAFVRMRFVTVWSGHQPTSYEWQAGGSYRAQAV